ncbi:MAG: hypothetical protein K0U52_09990 [Gammaproteobacteria bacterium]|nr:hypothetical protein [Gammaproteobacteria bacterium]
MTTMEVQDINTLVNAFPYKPFHWGIGGLSSNINITKNTVINRIDKPWDFSTKGLAGHMNEYVIAELIELQKDFIVKKEDIIHETKSESIDKDRQMVRSLYCLTDSIRLNYLAFGKDSSIKLSDSDEQWFQSLHLTAEGPEIAKVLENEDQTEKGKLAAYRYHTHLPIYAIKRLIDAKWDWTSLSLIRTTNDVEFNSKLPWVWGSGGLSSNLNITSEFVELFWDKEWDWGPNGLSSNTFSNSLIVPSEMDEDEVFGLYGDMFCFSASIKSKLVNVYKQLSHIHETTLCPYIKASLKVELDRMGDTQNLVPIEIKKVVDLKVKRLLDDKAAYDDLVHPKRIKTELVEQLA